MTRSTKRCIHCRLKLKRIGGQWLHRTPEDEAACAAYRAEREAFDGPR